VRRTAALAWSAVGATVALLIGATVLLVGYTSSTDLDVGLLIAVVPGLVAISVVGGLIASRRGNAVGWTLLAVAGFMALGVAGSAYLDAAIQNDFPLVDWAYWLAQWSFLGSLPLPIAVFFLFPTGTVTSPRWRWIWRTYLIAVAAITVSFALLPQESETDGVVVRNPIHADAIQTPIGVLAGIAGAWLLACAFLSLASIVVRYRGAEGEERQQIRWLAAVGAIAFAGMVLQTVLGISFENTHSIGATVANAVQVITVGVLSFGIPAACAVAIFKYHLYDLNVVVRKTVVVTAMAIALTGVYLLVALAVPVLIRGVGGGFDLFPLIGAAVVALAFDPIRRRARRLADRFVYGDRASPYEVLTGFGEHLGESYSLEDVLPRMAAVLAKGTGASTVRIWLRVGTSLRPEAAWPPEARPAATLQMASDDLPTFDGASAVPVRQQGDLLGAITAEFPPNDPADPAKEQLIRDLASQAGLVLRNVGLIQELRASRQRLVAAQDEERRKLERNIHDGAQQQLVALTVKLRILGQLAGSDAQKAEALATQLQAEATEALGNLRDLARGIYPPLLADRGLAAALEAQARKAAVPTTVEADGSGRYSQDVEATVYFSVLEALQNVAKYADASSATVNLAHTGGSLTFSVTDDGHGFDPAATGYGTGLQGMADRLDAIGGTLDVRSSPGGGTTIAGHVPVEETL
jgi:signal transduction histidine kinase